MILLSTDTNYDRSQVAIDDNSNFTQICTRPSTYYFREHGILDTLSYCFLFTYSTGKSGHRRHPLLVLISQQRGQMHVPTTYWMQKNASYYQSEPPLVRRCGFLEELFAQVHAFFKLMRSIDMCFKCKAYSNQSLPNTLKPLSNPSRDQITSISASNRAILRMLICFQLWIFCNQVLDKNYISTEKSSPSSNSHPSDTTDVVYSSSNSSELWWILCNPFLDLAENLLQH